MDHGPHAAAELRRQSELDRRAARLIARALSQPFGCLSETMVSALQFYEATRLLPILVRMGSGRFVAPAQDAVHMARALIRSGDYVRDYSIPAGDHRGSWPVQ